MFPANATVNAVRALHWPKIDLQGRREQSGLVAATVLEVVIPRTVNVSRNLTRRAWQSTLTAIHSV